MMSAIFKKEMKLFVVTPLFTVVAPLFFALCNFFFYNGIVDYLKLISSPDYKILGLQVWSFIFPEYFSRIFFIFSLVIPVLTMRLVAEEKKLHTYELIMALPIKPYQYIWGKYLATLTFCIMLLILTVVAPLALTPYTDLEWAPLCIAYVGLLLYTMFYVAVGLYFSTLTTNQFVAGIATFGFSLFFMVISWLAYIAPPAIERLLTQLLIIKHVSSFFDGFIYLCDVTLFVSGAMFFIYLAQRKVFIEYPNNS